MTDVFGVFSAKGGVGKTTLVANLGASLANVFGKNVLIFDTNLKTSHLGLHFGIYEDLSVTLREVLQNKAPILHAVYTHPQTGVRIIPAPLSGDSVSMTKNKLANLCNEIRENYDIMIVDTSPGLGKEFVSAADAVDKAIIVTTPEIPSLTDAMKSIAILKKMKKEILGLVVSRVANEKYELTLKEIESTANKKVIGVIHEDRKIPESIAKGIPVVLGHPNSKVAADFNEIAGLLVGEEYQQRSLFDAFAKIFDIFKPKERQIFVRPKEIQNVEKEKKINLKEEATNAEQLRGELLNQVRDEIKKEIKEKIKKRLMEKGI